MMMWKPFRFLGWCLVLSLAVWCIGAAAGHFTTWQRTGYETKYVRDWRAIVRSVPQERVGFLVSGKADLTPLERTRLIAVNWELGARPAEPVASSDIASAPPLVLSSRDVGGELTNRFEQAGYSVLTTNDSVKVWARANPSVTRPELSLPTAEREAVGAFALIVALVGLVVRLGHLPVKLDLRLLSACGVFAVLSLVALAHPLLAPNGLGVFAGKAKLFLASGGVPAGFWTDPVYAPYQPSYPPGLALLSAVCFLLEGGCGDVFVQLLVPCALTMIYWTLVAEARDPLVWLVSAVAVLSPLAQKMSAGFYAEPFCALCLVVGLRRVLALKDARGWWCVGCAALFRHEGLILSAVFAACLSHGTLVRRFANCLIAALPGVAWQLFVRSAGAGLYEFSWWMGPSGRNLAAIGEAIFRICSVEACLIGGVVLWAGVLCVRMRIWRTDSKGSRCGVCVGVSLVAGAVLLSFCSSPYYTWVVKETIPRYVWLVFVPTLLPLCGDPHLKGLDCHKVVAIREWERGPQMGVILEREKLGNKEKGVQ